MIGIEVNEMHTDLAPAGTQKVACDGVCRGHGLGNSVRKPSGTDKGPGLGDNLLGKARGPASGEPVVA